CYGLAEGTLIVAGGLKDQPVVTKTILSEAFKQNQIVSTEPAEQGTQTLVGCGQQLFEQRLLVVNQTTLTPCQNLEIGEIWVGGKTVAHGYWNRPEDTAATFQAFLADTGEGPFLRTGDLGFFDQGELFVTGRIKDLIIVHGQNHYPQDIELTVEQCHPALRAGSGAAFTVDVAGSEQLVVVQELEFRQKPDLADVFATIQEAIAQGHDLQCHAIAIIKPGSIFKTTSGKIRRKATQAAFLASELELVPDGLWQANLEQVAAEVLLDAPPLPSLQSAGNLSQPGRDIAHWLINRIATLAKIPASEVDVRQSFARYGLSSIDAVALAGELEDWLGIPVSPTLVWDHSTIESVAHFLASDPLPTLKPSDEKELPESDLIAVVGIGCRFGGGIDSPDAFWDALRTDVDTVTEVLPSRLERGTFLEPDQSVATDSRWRFGSFLDRIDEFDARFFGITPREANRLDPQHRLLLEITWEALEQAGIAADRLAGSQTGVFIGISTTDYSRLSLAEQSQLDPYVGTGNALSIAANRISYLFDLKGPSMAIDTACSSSLVAIHQACQSLRLGESTLAIVGGVNLMILPELSLTFAKANMLAADGRCKTFDARADGYVRSEGAGVVILKPLAAALQEGLPVLAVIRGSAINQDGRTNGLTAPNGSSQQAVIRQALENAKVSPADVSYIEAHGTGTPLGDPVEVLALRNVLEPHRPEDFPCVLGSVKTNLGHLEAAAGIAGVIKTVLALKYQYLPAHLHFESLNPNISLGTALVLYPAGCTWEVPSGKTRIAGVSSFGFGGTNAHVVLAEAPAIPQRTPGSEPVEPVEHGLLLSAPTQSALKTLASRFASFVKTNPALDLGNLCFTSFVGRSRFRHQVILPARSLNQLLHNLTCFLEEQPVPGTSLDLEALYREPNEYFHRITLPTYPFERERYWVESQGSGTEKQGSGFRVQGSGPELGFRVQGSGFGISTGKENN
ncbi:MAG TPA: beta-ketoacyl synthase N-terminal-like domain-containing protein, partial [Acidobacteriota bacterium]|nr:beta-ketoacyl synthase N-terminal-like domain-containing protein [Acidobacteriota bacterium]